MAHGFKLLLITGLLIVVATFCFVFSFDKRNKSKTRKILLGVSLLLFLIIGLLIVKIWNWPLD
ncbi:hypothetical protein DK873_03410 [Lactobacillus melliventris]|uniref:Uncharacterized protein n=1 Tax=Lactobacillus melliventris TaxID=1218507 RepID=A0ABX5MZD2_9LACO|nr:hypothetical protein DK873_03410 [Lactobacillus melliventris]RMC61657.1 hypothetical protein F5ESL0259_02695 [Lactobacillus sp. ESL0259]